MDGYFGEAGDGADAAHHLAQMALQIIPRVYREGRVVHRCAVGDQPLDEMRADEARAAGDQHPAVLQQGCHVTNAGFV